MVDGVISSVGVTDIGAIVSVGAFVGTTVCIGSGVFVVVCVGIALGVTVSVGVSLCAKTFDVINKPGDSDWKTKREPVTRETVFCNKTFCFSFMNNADEQYFLPSYTMMFSLLSSFCQVFCQKTFRCPKKSARAWIRTMDLCNVNATLYQLSYTRMVSFIIWEQDVFWQPDSMKCIS